MMKSMWRIRRRLEVCALRIVAFTANAMEVDYPNVLAPGMDDYFANAVQRGELRTRLERWLQLPPLGG